MDKLTEIRRPVADDLVRYKDLFDETLSHEDDFLGRALEHVRSRKGKMMRPLLVLLMAKEIGEVKKPSLLSAVTIELLHTASLVHDDVVDESEERRGQKSVNAVYDNKVAVLLGDYLLSKSLLKAAETEDIRAVKIISRLGGILSEGEIYQLANIRNEHISEEAYFRIIEHKTAALFSACAQLGVYSAGGSDEYAAVAKRYADIIGLCFQIRDDIFDYYKESVIGKPTYNDMHEGKLTLPVIYAVTHTDRADVKSWADKVKKGSATEEEISALVEYTKEAGGIDYAEKKMDELYQEAVALLPYWKNDEVRASLKAYADFVLERNM